MGDRTRYAVNAIGEDPLLDALKRNDESRFLSLLRDGYCPYIPSPYGQCAGGLKAYWPVSSQDFVEGDWYFDPSCRLNNCAEPPFAMYRRAKSDLLAYTLPILSGIHLAAAVGDISEISRQLKNHASLDAWGYLPLIYAVGCNQYEAVRALRSLEEKADLRQGCFLSKPENIVGPGLFNIPVGMRCHFKLPIIDPQKSPLKEALTIHQAAAKGDMEKLRTLVRLGVPVDIASFNGSTPLLCAALYGQSEACRYLLEQGADRHFENFLGETPDALLTEVFDSRSEMTERIFCQQSDLPKASEFDVHKRLGTLTVKAGFKEKRLRRSHTITPNETEINPYPDNKVDEGDLVEESDLADDIVKYAKSGNFQALVHAYLAIEENDKHHIPRNLIDQVNEASHFQNKDLLTAWLFISTSCQDKNVMKTPFFQIHEGASLIEKGGTNAILRMLRDGYGINQIDGLLDYACKVENPGLLRWLLRYGACIDQIDESNFSQVFKTIIEHEREKRQFVCDERPGKINDEILFAITTNNIELLSEYICNGFDFERAQSEFGLTLFELAKFIENSDLNGYIENLKRGTKKFVRSTDIFEEGHVDDEEILVQDKQDVISEDEPDGGFDGFIPLEGENQESSIEQRTKTTSPELTGGLSIFSTDNDEAGENDYDGDGDGSSGLTSIRNEHNSYFEKVRLPDEYANKLELVKGYLCELPFPLIVINEFLNAQRLQTEDELRFRVDDKPTLELFWALKLYTMAKIDEITESN